MYYSIDIKICATVYVKADSPEEALDITKGATLDTGMELAEDMNHAIPITGLPFYDDRLPDVSMSPAITLHGPYDESTVAEEAA